MDIKEKFKAMTDNYIINQVENVVLPNFEHSNIIRKKLIFKGRVQKVGFRFEVLLLANKLNLTGWVKNTIPFQTSRRNVRFLLRRCNWQGPHLAMTGEPRGFSRVTKS